MHAVTSTKESPKDVELFNEAFRAACEIYEPMGFGAPCHGALWHKDLKVELLPFWERGDETPIGYALRSAYEAGLIAGRKESQQSEFN